MLERISNDPVIPVSWGKNQPGMQAAGELDNDTQDKCLALWLEARDSAVKYAKELSDLGLHKEVCNRIVEPWMWTSTVVTATDWDNFYWLRNDPNAQPEIRVLAQAMLSAQKTSVPRLVGYGEWHLPFIQDVERLRYNEDTLLKCSVARCARVSYNNHDGSDPDINKDVDLYQKLVDSGHMSPLEHQATPYGLRTISSGNFRGWQQYRKTIANENRCNYPGLKEME
jgi:thymidylate synthase ThyX